VHAQPGRLVVLQPHETHKASLSLASLKVLRLHVTREELCERRKAAVTSACNKCMQHVQIRAGATEVAPARG
jgi:hypothetical protein